MAWTSHGLKMLGITPRSADILRQAGPAAYKTLGLTFLSVGWDQVNTQQHARRSLGSRRVADAGSQHHHFARNQVVSLGGRARQHFPAALRNVS